jgi:excisionase family DNA binding protein
MATKQREADSFELHNGNGEELLTKKQIAQVLKLSARSIDRKIAQGEFPKGMKIGSLVRWPKALIDKWISDQWGNRCKSEAARINRLSASTKGGIA